MKNEIDFKKVVENVMISIENKKEIEFAIVDTLEKFPNYTKEEFYLRLIQIGINNNDFTIEFKHKHNQIINKLINDLRK